MPGKIVQRRAVLCRAGPAAAPDRACRRALTGCAAPSRHGRAGPCRTGAPRLPRRGRRPVGKPSYNGLRRPVKARPAIRSPAAAASPVLRRGRVPCTYGKGAHPRCIPLRFPYVTGRKESRQRREGCGRGAAGHCWGGSARGEKRFSVLFGFSFPSRCKQAGERSSPKLRMPRQSHADFCSTDPAGGPPNGEGRRASRRGQHAASSCGGRGACPPWRVTLHAKRIASYALPGCRFKCRCRRGGQGRLKRQGKQGCACAA